MAQTGVSRLPTRLPSKRDTPIAVSAKPGLSTVTTSTRLRAGGASSAQSKGGTAGFAAARDKARSTPDLSAVSTRAAMPSRAVSAAAVNKLPSKTVRPVVTSKKRTATAANGGAENLHGGKKPMVQVDVKKPLVQVDSNKRKAPAPWDLKAHLEIAQRRIETLTNEKFELETAAKSMAYLREELAGLNEQLIQVNKELSDAREEVEAGRLLAAEHAVLKGHLEELKISKQKLMDEKSNTEAKLAKALATISDLEDDKRRIEQENCRLEDVIHTLNSEVQDLHSEVNSLVRKQFAAEQMRKRLHNTIQDLKGNIRVFCRVRPAVQGEKSKNLCHMVFPDEATLEITKSPDTGKNKGRVHKQDFTFDRVFPVNASQEDVFSELEQLVQSVLDGYNVCIFAYGQTGSGKTYTMDGGRGSAERGMIPRAVEVIFQKIVELETLGWKYEIEASFMEIYNEQIRDLLDLENTQPHEIRMVDAKSNDVVVTNIQTVKVKTAEELYHLLDVARRNRSVAATVRNDCSSRSHSVTKITLCGTHSVRKEVCSGTLNLIDLAGSERYQDANVDDRKKESVNINKSLSNLGIVILALSKQNDHIPYRNSKLTYLLMPSLGGNSKTLMLVNISPLEECHSETLNSLRFASTVNTCKTASTVKRQIKPTQ